LKRSMVPNRSLTSPSPPPSPFPFIMYTPHMTISSLLLILPTYCNL
jgi:hypothetical protein